MRIFKQNVNRSEKRVNMNEPNQEIARLLHPISETQELLGGLGRTTIYELIKQGEIEIVKIGSRSFVTHESLSGYVSKLSLAN